MANRLQSVVSLMLATWLCGAPSEGWSQNTNDADAGKAIELSLLTKGKKVIPLVCKYASLTITDIKLPDLAISNRLTEPVTPVEIEVIGAADGAKIAAFLVGRNHVVDFINQVNPQIKKILATSNAKGRLALGLGAVSLEAAHLSDNATLEPGQSAVLLLSRMLYFHVAGIQRIDRLEVIVRVESGKGRQAVTLNLPLHFHESKIQYIFPVRGSVTIANMPMNYLHHRQAHSQEFALDITAQTPNANGQLRSCRKENSSELSDYYIYRREVLAAADGVVVEIANSFPERESVSPAGWTQKDSDETMARLASRIGFQNAAFGNYIIIQHASDEFSFYAHLSQDSIRVRQGDKVKAGQVIALVGSTGNSSEPHLHFHVMDSREGSTANGLPVKFSDVPPTRMNQFFSEANSIATSDYLHVFLPAIGEAADKGNGIEQSAPRGHGPADAAPRR